MKILSSVFFMTLNPASCSAVIYLEFKPVQDDFARKNDEADNSVVLGWPVLESVVVSN